ncbi:rhodanese-like domain-containing protein [Cucumibacter marinus]|uniref:rhodanese-like domain-containing protein n=1 Tax=Cucumibacter marinus TaxID=1121252 RepID=UPI00048B32C3|nr:rhodanese-like domain-containing protein [Cucumibacter marinus]
MSEKKTAGDLVNAAMQEIETISVDEARSLQDKGEAVLIDIRESGERVHHGKVPGALSVPRGVLEFWIDPQSPYHKPELATGKKLVLFCAAAGRSALAAKSLQDMGYPNVAHIAGGFSAWAEAGAPVEKGEYDS